MCAKSILKHSIEIKRLLMMNAAQLYGFDSEVTLKHSQELDKLLNQYQSFSKNNDEFACKCQL